MPEKKSENSSPSRGLKREVGFIGLLFTGLAAIIGSGWLFAPLYAAQMAGPSSIISWLIGAIISMSIALVLAELGCMLPLAGGLVRYAHFAYGGVASFVGAWLAWIGYVTTAPIEVIAILQYMGNYIPGLDTTVDGFRVLTTSGILTSMALLALFTSINYFGVKWLMTSNTAITWYKLLIPIITPIILIIVCFRAENFTEYDGFFAVDMAGTLGAVSGAGIIFAFSGFRTIVDMAGEAKNPQRNIPLALVVAILITTIIYILLQTAFIGVLTPETLAAGWSNLATETASGPFAAFAVALGLPLLATVLYIDAVLSPMGTGLIYTGATTRLTYAMSRNGYLPPIFERLNNRHVPGWGLFINFAIGCFMLLPFPGWQQLVEIISSSVVLAMAFAPICLLAFRFQLPDQKRKFRLPFAIPFCYITFAFCNLIVYWTGWETLWKVIVMVFMGLILLPIGNRLNPHHQCHLNWKSAAWLPPYFIGILVISYLGSFGGIGLLEHGYDQAVVILFSFVIITLSLWLRLPNKEVSEAIRYNLTASETEEEIDLPSGEGE